MEDRNSINLGINILGFLIIFAISIIYFELPSFSISFLDELIENLQSTPLFTLKTSSCSNALELGYWGGIQSGCDCLGKSDSHKKYSKKNKIDKGSCSHQDKGCKDISSISKVSLQIYEGIRFCFNEDSSIVKHGYKYYLDNSVPFNSKCKEGYKQCGILDTLNQILCLKENESCPINDFYIDSNEKSNPEYKVIPLKNNKYLHYTNSRINNSILIKLKLSENNEPCINPGEYSWNYHYELEPSSSRCQKSFLNSTVDYRYKFIDSTNKYDIYKDNGIIDKTDHLPRYNRTIIQNENLNLYHRTYLGFEKQCLNDFSFEYLDSIKGKISTSRICIAIEILYLFSHFFGILLMILDHSRIKNILSEIICLRFVYIWIKDSEENYIIFLNINLLFSDLFIFILNLIIFVSLMNVKIKFECGDEIINGIISKMKKSVGTSFVVSIIILIITIIEITSDLCILIPKVRKKIYAYFHIPAQLKKESLLNQKSVDTPQNNNSEMNDVFTSNNEKMLGNNSQFTPITPQNNNNLTPNDISDNDGFTPNIPYNKL